MSRRLLIRLLASAPTATDHVADAELLRRFARSADPAALELLVRRHADAVWSTCRRMLRSDADAEDAFQATFLALIRHAKAVRTPCAGGWLHRVAVNAALKLRARAARVTSAEPAHLDAIPVQPTEAPDTERAVAVHEELARLPERERLPVVLCDLEGLSHADAAKALGWPVGTVSGRLSRARAKLRDRLARRGLAPASALVPVLPAPPHLIPGALSLTAGAIPPVVVSLSEGAIAMLKTTSWTWAVVAVACAGLVGTGGAIALTQPGTKPTQPLAGATPPGAALQPAQGKPNDGKWVTNEVPPTAFPELALLEPNPADPNALEKQQEDLKKRCPRLLGQIALKIEPTDDTLQKLLKARLHQGVREYQRARATLEVKGPDQNEFPLDYDLLTDLLAAATELWAGQPKELVPWLGELLVASKESERYMRLRVQAGTFSPRYLEAASRHRLKVEAELWKAKNAK